MNQAVLQLHDLVKTFKKNGEEVHAVKSIDISINSGEMVCFLGPSGCGKTTTLRMVAGFETPTSGMITINGNDVTNIPVNKRGIGFVFQNYALFPHLSVANNIAYGLRTQHMDETMIKQKITSSLKLVGLPDIGERYPSELSGGEQQRVALARVIVMEPSLLLMDEPLSNLDAKLRIHMRTEIRHLQKKLGITCLYVTHDQSEALTVADKIVVMSKGEVEQMGTPFEIYHSPKTSFVADFIGQANIIPSTVISSNTQNITAKIF
ncbi:MAG: ABC transporter ATP-binding protein, partial [Sphaerochaetaceae bacterium]